MGAATEPDASGSATSGVRPDSWWMPAPGWTLYGLVLLSFAVTIVVSSAPDRLFFLGLVAVGTAFPLGPLYGLVFAAECLRGRLRFARQWWARWLAIPAIVLFGYLLTHNHIPMRARLALSRAELEGIVALMTRPGGPSELDERSVGSYHIDWIERDGADVLFFSGGGILSAYGFAYSADGPPENVNGYDHLDGPWYLFWVGD